MTKEIEYLLRLINQIIIEKKNHNCKFKFNHNNNEIYNENKTFIMDLEVIHKIKLFNKLLKMEIIFNLLIEMYIRSGNTIIKFSTCKINYQDKEREIIIKPNFTCLLVNNNLGNYSITYCSCNNCENCKNRKNKKPFDDLLLYLRKKYKIKYKPEYTQLWYGKYNSYRNNVGYKCSFCSDFYKKKLNIVKLYCIKDCDHSCIFWICFYCYNKKIQLGKSEICPNCENFEINFSKLKSIYRFKKKLD